MANLDSELPFLRMYLIGCRYPTLLITRLYTIHVHSFSIHHLSQHPYCLVYSYINSSNLSTHLIEVQISKTRLKTYGEHPAHTGIEYSSNAKMSDPLSIAASVAGLITISAQIVGIAKELFDKVEDAPETMMRVREEVESIEPIFHQVQRMLNGSGSGLNRGNLTMISIHNLMATLTGCVIVYTRLEKKVNEVCGFSDPTSSWKRAGVVANRVKLGLWRHEEVLIIIEELQRHKLSLNMMLTILSW